MPESAPPPAAPPATAPPPGGQSAPPPTAPSAADGPKPIVLLPDDYSAIQRELAELRAFRTSTQTQAEAAEAERLKVLAAKGQAEEAMGQLKSGYETKVATLQTKAEAIERQWLAEKLDGTISQAFAGLEFAGVDPSATARHLQQILRPEIEAVMDRDGKPVVRDKTTLQDAAKYLRERLAAPEFALYFRPTGRQGSGTDGTRTRPQPQGEVKPGSIEAITAEWQARQARSNSFGLHPKVS